MAWGGRIVHLADADGIPACGQKTSVTLRVPGCITCKRCRAASPTQAARHEHKRIVIYADPSPYYDALGAALRAGATKMPRVTPRAIPVFEGTNIKEYLAQSWDRYIGQMQALAEAGEKRTCGPADPAS